MLRVLSPDGVAEDKFPVDHETIVSMYKDMVLSRVLDRFLLLLQRMGKVGIHAPSEGQEAVGVGTAYALRENDWVFPLYRELPVYVAMKVPVEEIINRYFANAADPLKGSDFAVYGNKAYRIVPAPIPVSLHIAPAVGFALALKLRRLGDVVVNFFGDGATSKGEFHEALNFAGVFKAPVVFVCQNNQYAISTPFSRQTAAETVSQKAVAYGFEGVRVDGNDVVACFVIAKNAVEKARRGQGPVLIEAVTYRIGPHTTADDPSRYRSEDEVERWRRVDPITRLKKYLIRSGLLTEEEDERLWRRCEERVREAVAACEKIPPLPVTAILENVFVEEPWYIAEEKEELSQQT